MGVVQSLNGGAVIASPGNPDERVVDLLEEALEAAMSGEISSVVLIQGYADGSSSSRRAGIINSYRMVGAMEDVKYRILRDENE